MKELAVELTNERKERRKTAMRQRILNAAVEVFSECGVEAPSVEQICVRADVSRMTFYNHFTGKQQLIYLLSETLMMEAAAKVLEQARAQNPNSVAMLRFYISHSAAAVRDYPPLQRELLWQMHIEPDMQVSARRFNQVHQLLEDLIALGQFREEINRAHSAEFYCGLIFGAMSNATIAALYRPQFAVYERMLELADFAEQLLRP